MKNAIAKKDSNSILMLKFTSINNWEKMTKNLFVIIGLLLFIPFLSHAQKEQTKEFEEEYSGKTKLEIAHHRGPLTIKKSQDGKIKVYVKMTVSAKDESTIEALFNKFEIKDSGGGERLRLDLEFQTSSWVTINGVSKIKFSDGTTIKGLKDFKSEFTVWIPDLESLSLETKYDEINVEPDLAGDLAVKLHSGKLYAQNVKGNLSLEMKYGKAQLKNVGDAEIDLYDTDIELGNAGKVSMKAKYSEVKFKEIAGLELETYDGKLTTANVAGDISISDKYSDFSIQSFKKGELEIYDGTFTCNGKAESLVVQSKYTEYDLGELGELSFSSSYDDDIKVNKLGSLNASSKYSQYIIGQLTKKISALDSYDDLIKIGTLSPGFKSIEIDGKYAKLEIESSESTKYSMDVLISGGLMSSKKIAYPEDQFENQYYKEVSSTLEIRAKKKGATENDGKIKIRGYEHQIRLN